MDSNQLHKPSDASMAAGYELSTVSVRGLIYFVIGLILVAAAVHAGIWYLLVGYDYARAELAPPSSALVDEAALNKAGLGKASARLPLPPPPRLQPNPDSTNVPEADLQLMYSREDELFTRMGWRINPQTHVPLEVPESAMDQVIRDHARTSADAQSSPDSLGEGRERGKDPLAATGAQH